MLLVPVFMMPFWIAVATELNNAALAAVLSLLVGRGVQRAACMLAWGKATGGPRGGVLGEGSAMGLGYQRACW